jgi:predicted dehydrogenase
MTAPLPIAIIGAAHSHLDYVLDEVAAGGAARIVAVVEHDPARLASLRQRTGAPGYADHQAMLREHRIAAAAVVTEFGDRARIVADLAAQGILSIVDKPLAVRMADLDAVTTALRGRDLVALMLEKRFYPVTLALRELVAAGRIGQIVAIHATGPHKLRPAGRPAWLFDQASYGGILADLAVHDIDLALLLCGAGSGQVSGWISPLAAPGTAAFAGFGRALVSCDGGPQIAIEVDWLQPDASPRHGDYAMRVTGTHGRADALFAQARLVLETHAQPAQEVTLPEGQPPARFAFDHLVSGAPLAIPTADALRATRIAILAQRSAEAGGQRLDW